MSLLQSDQPLYMPEGSVRAVLALGVVGAYLAGFVGDLEIVTLILGFYFGQKVAS